jgi:hypothetical protein
MTTNICSKCGTADNVKPAGEYAELTELLEAWNLSESQAPIMLCPKCAAGMREIDLDEVKILPLDFFETGDPDEES